VLYAGKIDLPTFGNKMRIVEGLRDLALNGLLPEFADDVAKAADFVKMMRYVSTALEIGGLMLSIAGFIAEAIGGAIVRNKMIESADTL
jgi:hypothetical protein